MKKSKLDDSSLCYNTLCSNSKPLASKLEWINSEKFRQNSTVSLPDPNNDYETNNDYNKSTKYKRIYKRKIIGICSSHIKTLKSQVLNINNFKRNQIYISVKFLMIIKN